MPILTAEERIGTVLGGRYRLDCILGTGGTSVVYDAKHSFTGRRVALKILKPEHSRDRGLVARFLREARVASTVLHPHVVAILDMGTEAGDTYIAMELVEGEPLSAVLAREGRLSLDRTLALLRPVMDAVALAHGREIVHRDLKPDNIIVGDRGDGAERAILLDFGMAKTVDAAWGHMTQSGVIVGTPLFMSPEQAEGAADVGPASDVWSMGVTLYRCLAGELPFVATSPTALLLAIARGDHEALGARAPSLPTQIAAWVEGALVVDRAKRYPDMGAMLVALDRALAGQAPVPVAEVPIAEVPVARSAPSIPEAPAVVLPRAKSSWGMVLAGAIALAVVALGTVIALRGTEVAVEPSVTAPVVAAPVAAAPVLATSPVEPVVPSVASAPPASVAASEPAASEAAPPPVRGRSRRAPRTPSATTAEAPRGTGLATEW